MNVVIVGGGAALAQSVINHFLITGNEVTAVCRSTPPSIGFLGTSPEQFRVATGLEKVDGPIDILITMTGATRNARITEMTLGDWRAVQDANLASVFEALRYCLPKMHAGGNVVVVGSIVGSTGGKGCANYAAAKAGLVGLVRAAANEVAERGICVNLLELGYIDAGMGAQLPEKVKAAVLPTIPLGRFGSTEDVVAAVDYLGRVRYATGTVLTLAGGLR